MVFSKVLFDFLNSIVDSDLQFLPISTRDLTPPFPQDTVPTVKALLDLNRIPLWMFADMKWNLYIDIPISRLTIF